MIKGTTTAERYLLFLKGVRATLKANPKASLTTVTISYGVSNALATILKEEEYVIKDDRGNTKWVGELPSMELAEFLRQKIKARNARGKAPLAIAEGSKDENNDAKHNEVLNELKNISSLLSTLVNLWNK